MKQELPVKKNEQLIVTVSDLTHEGLGVAKIDGYPLFIENALPDEVVKIHVLNTGKKFGYAKALEWKETSPVRAESFDTTLIRTGIAPLLHLKYHQQLAFKRRQIVNNMAKIAGMPEVPVSETIGMEKPFGYRNKAQIPVQLVNGQLETGFYRKNSHVLVPIEDFCIQNPVIDTTVVKVRNILREVRAEPYNEQQHTGDIRHIVIRLGHYSHELMIILVTRKPTLPGEKFIVKRIVEEVHGVNSIIQNINTQKTNVILGKEDKVLYGKATITDMLSGNKYEISPQSFYQVNTEMAEVLYQTGTDFAKLSKDDVVIDAYCGIGTIGQSLASRVKHVYGMEIVPQAIVDAKKNAEVNGHSNTTYIAGKAEDVMRDWLKEGINPAVIFVDPPRKGLDPDFIKISAEMQPRKIIYISCNSATFARDAKIYHELGYNVEKIQPVDLFPQTHHIELAALLTIRH